MDTLQEEFSSKCSMDNENHDLEFDESIPEPETSYPPDHSYQDERDYLKTMVKTIDLWKIRLRKEKLDKSWVKFLFCQNQKMIQYQKYILFDGYHPMYDDLDDNQKKEITKMGKIIQLTRTKICSKTIEPKTILLYLKKVYNGLEELVNQLQVKQDCDKSINMIIKKVKNL